MIRFILLLSLVTTFAFACNVKLNPTVRERYAKNFEGPDSLLDKWKAAYEQARGNVLPLRLPASFLAPTDTNGKGAVYYELVLQAGHQLLLELQPIAGNNYFAELYKKNDGKKAKPLEEMEMNSYRLVYAVDKTDTFHLMIQPALYTSAVASLRIYPQPVYLFPVAGKGNAAMSSFWGAPRDGGSRSHEGIDIFAAKGTPLLAVADGRVHSTGERGLGGKQVWLREEVLGRNIYYANLDSIIAKDGDWAKRGDTLGLVGNTGNAAGGSPHLHFAVYNNGAVDPLHYIKQLPVPDFKKATK